MPRIIVPPAGVLHPRDATFFLRWTNRSAGQSLAGRDQVISTNSGIWQVDYSLPTQFGGEKLRLFEMFIRELHGRANIAAVPVCDPFRYGPRVSPAQQPWSDGTWFSDGTGWVDGTSTQALNLTHAVAAGATQLYVSLTDPVRPSLRVGDFFSVNGFLYAVQARDGNGWVRFEPPAREAIPAGTQIQTDPAVAYLQLADDDQGRRAREMLRWGAPITIRFIEAFDR